MDKSPDKAKSHMPRAHETNRSIRLQTSSQHPSLPLLLSSQCCRGWHLCSSFHFSFLMQPGNSEPLPMPKNTHPILRLSSCCTLSYPSSGVTTPGLATPSSRAPKAVSMPFQKTTFANTVLQSERGSRRQQPGPFTAGRIKALSDFYSLIRGD